MLKKSELIDRWEAIENVPFTLKSMVGFDGNPSDYRGIPFGDNKFRANLKYANFEDVDFSYSNFCRSNFTKLIFTNCFFEASNLKDLRLWDCEFHNCNFIKSDFTNSTLGVNTIFKNCVFQNCKLNGRGFHFGYYSLFQKCTFSDCQVQSAWILSVTFENCIINSSFLNVRFSGIKEASLSRSRKEYPATFINCSMKGSYFKGLEIMDGVVLENTTLPNQEVKRSMGRLVYK